MFAVDGDIFAFAKPSLDAHTLGINSAAELLSDCGYQVIIGDEDIAKAINNIRYEVNRGKVLEWIRDKKVTLIGLSYRLDQDEAVNMVGYFMNELKNNNMLRYQGGLLNLYSLLDYPKPAR